jgi:hypothetical protein
MAKLNRESRLRDKRAQKEARKAARKLTAASDDGYAASGGEEPAAALDGLDAAAPDGDEPGSAEAAAEVPDDA